MALSCRQHFCNIDIFGPAGEQVSTAIRARCVHDCRCTPELLQYAALAHLVTGFTQRRPVFVQTAERILSALDQVQSWGLSHLG